MEHVLPPLPWQPDALAPIISAETIEYHYGKHHMTYVTNLNKLIAGTSFADATLEEIVQKAEGPVFNNGAQVWNHTFYWESLTPGGAAMPESVQNALTQAFGSVDAFREKFSTAAVGQFGSGWAWLVQLPDGSLAIETTSNAGCPLRDGKNPLLTCDVWEHAYYIDYRNARAKYVDEWWKLVDWARVAARMK